MSDQIEQAVRKHAELILKAKGTSLRNYMPNSQRDILAAVMDCYEEAYRAGADLALKPRAQCLGRWGDGGSH